VSEDGGPFQAWLSGTTNTAATFHGQGGKRYGLQVFYRLRDEHCP